MPLTEDEIKALREVAERAHDVNYDKCMCETCRRFREKFSPARVRLLLDEIERLREWTTTCPHCNCTCDLCAGCGQGLE